MAVVALGAVALGAVAGVGFSAGAGAVESAVEEGAAELGAIGSLGSLATSFVLDAALAWAGFFGLAFVTAGSSFSVAVAGAGAAAGADPASATTVEVSCEAAGVLSSAEGTEAFDATRLEVGNAA